MEKLEKDIKVSVKNWTKLMKLKIDLNKKTVNDVITELLRGDKK